MNVWIESVHRGVRIVIVVIVVVMNNEIVKATHWFERWMDYNNNCVEKQGKSRTEALTSQMIRLDVYV